MIEVSAADIQGTMPLLIAAGFGLIILLLDAFQRPGTSRTYLAYFAVLGLLATGLAAYVLWNQRVTFELFGGMAYLDGFGQALTVIFVLSGILTCLLAPEFLKNHNADRGEFYALIMFAVTGMIIVATSANLLVLFLGIEVLSISAYVLAGFFRHQKESSEAALKYLVLGAMTSGLFLFGIALVYGTSGSTDLSEIGRVFGGGEIALSHNLEGMLAAGAAENLQTVVHQGELVPMAFLGMVLIVVALGFKVAAVPFHWWAPDVYSGSPTPVVGFMATAVKSAGFAALIRVFVTAFFADPSRNSSTGWVQIFFALALVTMIVGNFGALVQNKLKRMLAYSSIAHAGYILIAFTASGYSEFQFFNSAVVFYLVAYTFGTVGAFGVLTYLGRKGEEAETYDDLNEMGYKYPWLGFSMAVFMLSAAGIPPTAGFFAKFLAFKTAIDASLYGGGGSAPALMITLAVVGISVSVAGVYYYLRVIVHMYMRKSVRRIRSLPSRTGAFAIAVCLVGVLALGLFPTRVNTLSQSSVNSLADTPEGETAQEQEYGTLDQEEPTETAWFARE